MCFHGKASVNSPSPFKHFELRLVIVPLIKSVFFLVSFALSQQPVVGKKY